MTFSLNSIATSNTLIQKTNRTFLLTFLMKLLKPILVVSILFFYGPSTPCFAALQKLKQNQTAEVSLKTISEPKDQELCFSPDEPCDLKLTKFIQTAKHSIDIAVYDINRDQLVHELIVASRKIPVRVVVDQRQSKGNHSLVPLLIKAGIQVRFGRQRGYMHNKFTIVDNKMIETGSYNYTNHATEANHENQIYLGSPTIVERYRNQFNEIWNNGKPAV